MILSAIFGALAVYLYIGVFRTWKKLKFKDRMWNGSRILFLVAMIFLLFTMVAYRDAWDMIRMLVMALAILSYLLLRDGIGDEGICIMGRLIPWSSVTAYDYRKDKKKFELFYEANEKKEASRNVITFEAKDEEEIIKFLKKKVGHKYRRMRKG